VWNSAEAQLQKVLEASGRVWKLNPGDGAFYGPKIDIHITDALNRSHQCATIQLDFQLPERFELEYMTEEGGAARPVMIHRAIFGSLERFLAIVIEHTGGKWPLWLSPRQLLVVPISEKYNAYAHQVQQRFDDAGFYVDVEDSDKTFKKKMALVREQEGAYSYNFVLVVGAEEEKNGTVNIRTAASEVLGEKSIDDAIAQFAKSVAEYK